MEWLKWTRTICWTSSELITASPHCCHHALVCGLFWRLPMGFSEWRNTYGGFCRSINLLSPNGESFLLTTNRFAQCRCVLQSVESFVQWRVVMEACQIVLLNSECYVEVVSSIWRLFKRVLPIGQKRLQKGVLRERNATRSLPRARFGHVCSILERTFPHLGVQPCNERVHLLTRFSV